MLVAQQWGYFVRGEEGDGMHLPTGPQQDEHQDSIGEYAQEPYG